MNLHMPADTHACQTGEKDPAMALPQPTAAYDSLQLLCIKSLMVGDT